MAEQAMILIPDISGFTEFTSTTEIDHAAHILSELLERIVSSNQTGFELAEIEGDAVLFYRKGEPLQRRQLVDQCLRMFESFHRRRMVIEQDTVCQCGACQSATNLTLKFVVHFGYIKELRVARFVKPTGLDMIVAHRLLKNAIDSHEYILLTAPCCTAVGPDSSDDLSWAKAKHEYETIGTIDFEYATLAAFRARIAPPPARPAFVVVRGEDDFELSIDAPLRTVYQTLVNVDKRPEWLGVDSIDRDPTSERIGMRHNCVFMGMKLVNTAMHSEFGSDRARYSEQVDVPETGLRLMVHYDLRARDGGTSMNVNVNWLDSVLPVEAKQAMLDAEVVNLERLKQVCETNPA